MEYLPIYNTLGKNILVTMGMRPNDPTVVTESVLSMTLDSKTANHRINDQVDISYMKNIKHTTLDKLTSKQKLGLHSSFIVVRDYLRKNHKRYEWYTYEHIRQDMLVVGNKLSPLVVDIKNHLISTASMEVSQYVLVNMLLGVFLPTAQLVDTYLNANQYLKKVHRVSLSYGYIHTTFSAAFNDIFAFIIDLSLDMFEQIRNDEEYRKYQHHLIGYIFSRYLTYDSIGKLDSTIESDLLNFVQEFPELTSIPCIWD